MMLVQVPPNQGRWLDDPGTACMGRAQEPAPAIDAPSQAELLFLAGQRPIIARKLRYFADREFAGLFDVRQRS
jgi:hypothetical protein